MSLGSLTTTASSGEATRRVGSLVLLGDGKMGFRVLRVRLGGVARLSRGSLAPPLRVLTMMYSVAWVAAAQLLGQVMHNKYCVAMKVNGDGDVERTYHAPNANIL